MPKELPERFTNPHTKFRPADGKNVLPKEVIEHPEYKPFFDTIAFISAEIKKQRSVETRILSLPKKLDLQVKSNYGITVQRWLEHNFLVEYGIELERK